MPLDLRNTAGPYGDNNVGAVLSWNQVDQNFIFLKGRDIIDITQSGDTVYYTYQNGDIKTIDVSSSGTSVYEFQTGTTNSIRLIDGIGDNTVAGTSWSNIQGGSGNTIATSFGKFSTILGGKNNYISGPYSVVGGLNNITYNGYTFVSGRDNLVGAGSYYSNIVGGKGNSINNNKHSVIIGGSGNSMTSGGILLTSYYNSIGGGRLNTISGSFNSSIVNGGTPYWSSGVGNNITQSAGSIIGGGDNNQIIGNNGGDQFYMNSFIGSGTKNKIDHSSISESILTTDSFIGGGSGNTLFTTSSSSIVGGKNNYVKGSVVVTNKYSFIGGGNTNYLNLTSFSNIIGGSGNTIDLSKYSNIVGGYSNTIKTDGGVLKDSISIVGGFGNYIKSGGEFADNSFASIIGGGYNNKIYSSYSSLIGAGTGNVISGSSNYSSIVGGSGNTINIASAYSTIIGGSNNLITGLTNSHIIGSNITAVSANTTHVERLNIGTMASHSTPLSGGTEIQNIGIDSSGTVKKSYLTKTIDIGDWDMDTDSNVNVNHGLSSDEYKTIRKISVMIRTDDNNSLYPLDTFELQAAQGGVAVINSSLIGLERLDSGFFDANSNFDDTSFNRGWITFDYIPD